MTLHRCARCRAPMILAPGPDDEVLALDAFPVLTGGTHVVHCGQAVPANGEGGTHVLHAQVCRTVLSRREKKAYERLCRQKEAVTL